MKPEEIGEKLLKSIDRWQERADQASSDEGSQAYADGRVDGLVEAWEMVTGRNYPDEA